MLPALEVLGLMGRTPTLTLDIVLTTSFSHKTFVSHKLDNPAEFTVRNNKRLVSQSELHRQSFKKHIRDHATWGRSLQVWNGTSFDGRRHRSMGLSRPPVQMAIKDE